MAKRLSCFSSASIDGLHVCQASDSNTLVELMRTEPVTGTVPDAGDDGTGSGTADDDDGLGHILGLTFGALCCCIFLSLCVSGIGYVCYRSKREGEADVALR